MELSANQRKKVLPWRAGPYAAPPADLKKAGARLLRVRKLEALENAFQKVAVHVESDCKAALLNGSPVRWTSPATWSPKSRRPFFA